MDKTLSRYVFGYFHTDNEKWKICNRSFILNYNINNKTCFGQYLTSNWFSYHTTPIPLKFVVLKIPKTCFGKKIENIINYQSADNFKHDYIESFSVFNLEKNVLENIFQNVKKKDSERIELSCKNNNKKLSLRFHYIPEKNCLSVSLPEIKFNY